MLMLCHGFDKELREKTSRKTSEGIADGKIAREEPRSVFESFANPTEAQGGTIKPMNMQRRYAKIGTRMRTNELMH